MTPEPPDATKSPQGGSPSRPSQPAGGGTDPPHRQIQAAHEKYFQDLALVWNAAQSRLQALQMEFERALETAWRTQDPNAYQAALAEYQRGFQAACMEASSPEPYSEALRSYKTAMQQAIAGATVDELNLTDMAHIGQSFTTVWPIAMMLTAPPPQTFGGGTPPSPRA